MDQNEKDKLIERLKKTYPYWWKWELLDVDPKIVAQILEELSK